MQFYNAMWLVWQNAGTDGLFKELTIWGASWHLDTGWSESVNLAQGAFSSSHSPVLCLADAFDSTKVQMTWKGLNDQHIYTVELQDGPMPYQTVPPVSGLLSRLHGELSQPASSFIDPSLLTTPFLTIDRPAMIFEGGGRCILAWRDPTNTLLWASRDANGLWGSQQEIGATTSHGPLLALADNNGIFVIWVAVGDGTIWWAKLDGANWVSPEPVPFPTGPAKTNDTPAALELYFGMTMVWTGFQDDQHIWVADFLPDELSTPAYWSRPFMVEPSKDLIEPSPGSGVLTTNGPALAQARGIIRSYSGVAWGIQISGL